MLRRKLILILALLEVSPPHHRLVLPVVRSRISALTALAFHGLRGLAALAMGVVLFGPVHLAARWSGDRRD
jgi:hypothetical protein